MIRESVIRESRDKIGKIVVNILISQIYFLLSSFICISKSIAAAEII